MEPKEGDWVACVFETGEKAVGHVREENGTLYVNCITEDNAVTSSKVENLASWCEIIIDWE